VLFYPLTLFFFPPPLLFLFSIFFLWLAETSSTSISFGSLSLREFSLLCAPPLSLVHFNISTFLLPLLAAVPQTSFKSVFTSTTGSGQISPNGQLDSVYPSVGSHHHTILVLTFFPFPAEASFSERLRRETPRCPVYRPFASTIILFLRSEPSSFLSSRAFPKTTPLVRYQARLTLHFVPP